jgi:hypothetical protein
MADDARSKKRSGGDEGRTDPHVERLRPDPAEPPQRVVELEGLLGDSDRPGFRRLYFTRSLTYYAEFRTEDVVFTEAVPPEQPPLAGLESSRVGIKAGAPIEYTRTSTAKPADEFDLDVRVAAPRQPGVPTLMADTWEAECPGPSRFGDCGTDFTCVCGETIQITVCRGATCIDVCTVNTCRTDCGEATCGDTCLRTCDTCRTQCGQPTCATCLTRCGQPTCQATCATCLTRCNQATCATCLTRCNQVTCRTCETRCGTCNPHIFTCGPNPQCL